ncbi:MAG: OB-fold nucleic acid binding domain-containing protein [Candidatus Diapherotrites archaeon]|nr:OB-fold nucleic acid binding domain-containing protein [Candidatus Diapherotrites archaeon]
MQQSAEEIVQTIVQKTGKSISEIHAIVQEKRSKFAGLLTEQGAAFLVARELGAGIETEKYASEKLSIAQLRNGLRGLEIQGIVQAVFPEKEFKKGEKIGKRKTILISDGSGEISCTFWNDQIQKLEKVENGDTLKLTNCFVTEYLGKNQLNIGNAFTAEIIEKNSKENSHNSSAKNRNELLVSNLGSLKENQQNLQVTGRIVRIYPLREFDKNGKQGKVQNFEIGDETKTITCTAWNESTTQVNLVRIGDIVKISGAYTKKGLKELELHLGLIGKIEQQIGHGKKIPLLKEFRKEIERKSIAELIVGEKFKEIRAKITQVLSGKLHFLLCGKCRGKLEKSENNYSCEKCGLIQEPLLVPVISLEVDDGTSSIKATFFDQQAEELLNMKTNDLEKELKTKSVESIITELNQKLEGKEIIVTGNVRQNPFNQEMEFTVREIIEIA